MKRILLAAMALICIAASADAQSKAETRLYNKTLKKPSLSAFDKFLNKYPSSVYAEDISARKDTLLNITPYTEAQAAEILSGFLPEGAEFKALPIRSNTVDRIYGICIGADSLALDYVRIYTLEKGKSDWSMKDSYEAPSADAQGMSTRVFVDDAASFKIRNERYFRFSYLMSSADAKLQTYVTACYSPESDTFDAISFSGKNILKEGDNLAYSIYGRSNGNMAAEAARPQIKLLISEMEKNPGLKAIPDKEYYTDLALEWWLENNPDALTNASKIKFSIIEKESSLVEEFNKAKGKKNSAKYTAAIFDHRGYSVIVAYQKDDDNYVLAWAEPECKNKYKDRLLNSISFRDANTLEMFYYHGNRTFKYWLNLTSKSLRR